MEENFKKYRALEEDVCHNYRWGGRRYYDAPDGEDLLGKVSFMAKIGTLIGWNLSLIQIMKKPPIKTLPDMITRTLKTTSVTAGMAILGTVTVYYATRIRQVDDPNNHLLGGMAAGAVLGASINKPGAGFLTAIILGTFAAGYKMTRLQGETLITPARPQRALPYARKMLNFSVLPDIKGNWTAVKPDN